MFRLLYPFLNGIITIVSYTMMLILVMMMLRINIIVTTTLIIITRILIIIMMGFIGAFQLEVFVAIDGVTCV